MPSTTDSKVTTRLFLGTPLHSDLRSHLQQSPLWRDSQLLPTPESTLILVWFHQKEYVGYYLAISHLTVAELKEHAKIIRQQIELYCPRLEKKEVSIVMFPQLFIN